MKRCTTCKTDKELDCFSNNKATKDGKHSQCKACNKIRAEKYSQDNPEKIKLRNKNKYYENIDKSRELSRVQYQKHKKRKLLQHKEWRELNTERVKDSQKEWYKINRESKLKQNADNERLQLQINPLFRIKKNLRTRIPNALRGKIKYKGTMEYLGCTIQFLKDHLEKQFNAEMTWENYGSYWHVDHIRPCSSFDLSKMEEQQRCFHYTNLQPLEAIENLKKYNKVLVLT